MNRLELFDVPIPAMTESYAPVSHQNVIETVLEQLDKRNLQVVKETYNTAANGNKVIGYFDLEYNGNSEMGMRLAFRNSYDKSMSVAFVAGANVWICSNGMVTGDIKFIRKHTGSVATELTTKINETIFMLEDNFIKINNDSMKMKQIGLVKEEAAAMYGKMFMIEDILTATQMSIVKRELEKPTYPQFEEESLWSAYNHATFALKESHPIDYMRRHMELHDFVKKEFVI